MGYETTLFIFEGHETSSDVELAFSRVRIGVLWDQIDKAQTLGLHRIILVTPHEELGDQARKRGVQVVLHKRPLHSSFHFGQTLRDVVNESGCQRVLYMGGASAPLLCAKGLKELLDVLETKEQVVTANNLFSSDIVGFYPASILSRISLPKEDNALAFLLHSQGKLPFFPLTKSVGLSFDLDTPADLPILALHPRRGPHTVEALKSWSLDLTPYRRIQETFQDFHQELVVYGRVNSRIMQELDASTKCRVRLFSEERGMKTLGRDTRGEVVSVMGRLMEEMGFEKFFRFLPQVASGAILDSRVLFSHFRWDLSQDQRFYSDLGQISSITHKPLRAFTEAAWNCGIPVLLGGHSLVTGGLWALLEASLDWGWRGP